MCEPRLTDAGTWKVRKQLRSLTFTLCTRPSQHAGMRQPKIRMAFESDGHGGLLPTEPFHVPGRTARVIRRIRGKREGKRSPKRTAKRRFDATLVQGPNTTWLLQAAAAHGPPSASAAPGRLLSDGENGVIEPAVIRTLYGRVGPFHPSLVDPKDPVWVDIHYSVVGVLPTNPTALTETKLARFFCFVQRENLESWDRDTGTLKCQCSNMPNRGLPTEESREKEPRGRIASKRQTAGQIALLPLSDMKHARPG
ncbi:hypothetical protein VTK26DRAFT_8217 [Humicola hyalothermophila]